MLSFSSIFSRQPAPLLGLDIGSASARLVELGLDKTGQLVLQRCAELPLGKGWTVCGSVERFDELADAVRRLLKASGSKTKNVAMALPPTAVITKKVKIRGGMSDRDLALQVQIEANQYIPFPMDETNLDFCIAGPCADSPNDIDVLIAASRREKVQDIQGLAEAAGLKPQILDIASYASRLALDRLIKNLPNQGRGSMVALFELGAFESSLQVVCDDDVLYDRDQTFSGEQLTQMITQEFGLSLEMAEVKKLSNETLPGYEARVLHPFIDELGQKINKSLEGFFNGTVHNHMDYVMLAGDCAALAGLPAAVTKHTAFPCLLVNPFEGMAISEQALEGSGPQMASAYLTACGLALRRFAK